MLGFYIKMNRLMRVVYEIYMISFGKSITSTKNEPYLFRYYIFTYYSSTFGIIMNLKNNLEDMA